MGCGKSKHIAPNSVIQPISTSSLGDALAVQQSLRVNGHIKPAPIPTGETIKKDRMDLNLESSLLTHGATSENRGLISPKSVGFFNVACWCNDKELLRSIERNPILEYRPSGATSKIVFNRISAFVALEAKTQVTAVIYLVAHADDVPLVRRFYHEFEHIWNHFVVVSGELEDWEIPDDLEIPVLRANHNLHKEIHDSYLDQLVVIDAFLSQEKDSTPNTRKMETIDLIRKNTITSDQGLSALRKFWVINRFRLWKLRETLGKQVAVVSARLPQLLISAAQTFSTETPLSEGNVHLTFGETGMDYQTQLNVHLGTNAIMEYIALPTASLIKYSDRDCWMCLSLMPNPECVSTIDEHALTKLASSTYEKLIQENPPLKELFGYDIQ
jgi:hypothetical protein